MQFIGCIRMTSFDICMYNLNSTICEAFKTGMPNTVNQPMQMSNVYCEVLEHRKVKNANNTNFWYCWFQV